MVQGVDRWTPKSLHNLLSLTQSSLAPKLTRPSLRLVLCILPEHQEGDQRAASSWHCCLSHLWRISVSDVCAKLNFTIASHLVTVPLELDGVVIVQAV